MAHVSTAGSVPLGTFWYFLHMRWWSSLIKSRWQPSKQSFNGKLQHGRSINGKLQHGHTRDGWIPAPLDSLSFLFAGLFRNLRTCRRSKNIVLSIITIGGIFRDLFDSHCLILILIWPYISASPSPQKNIDPSGHCFLLNEILGPPENFYKNATSKKKRKNTEKI